MTDAERAMLKELLWGMYQENTTDARHNENQRSTVTNAIIVLAGALIALVTFDRAINPADLPATVFLIGLGIFGAVFSAQHFAKYSMNKDRARQYRIALDIVLPGLSNAGLAPLVEAVYSRAKDPEKIRPIGVLAGLKGAGEEEHKQGRYARLGEMTPGGLHALWIGLHGLITVLGVILTTFAIFFPQEALGTPDGGSPPRIRSALVGRYVERFHDPATPITISPGERLEIEIESQPGSGYRWVVVNAAALGPLRLVKSDDPPRRSAWSRATRTQRVAFFAPNVGRGLISLVYIRPWESRPPVDTIRFPIIVR